jgi:hypothetical protein
MMDLTRRKGSRYSLVLEELQGLRLDSDSEINKWQPVRKTLGVLTESSLL